MHSFTREAEGDFRGVGMKRLLNRTFVVVAVIGLTGRAQAYQSTEQGPSRGEGDFPYCNLLRVGPDEIPTKNLDPIEDIQNMVFSSEPAIEERKQSMIYPEVGRDAIPNDDDQSCTSTYMYHRYS